MEEDRRKDEKLPPGFRFHPTDEELINYYLINKISDATFSARAVTDVDLNKSEPWELPGKAKMGEKEWYFFSLRDRKYPTGVRTNRATNTGYWKTTGKDKEIFNSVTSDLVGMKKTLVFYRGRAPRGEKTNWVMHEYRIHSKSTFRSAKDEWVVCRVFQKSAGGKKYPSIQSTRTPVSNLYNLDLAPNYYQPQMMQQALDHNSTTLQFPMGRNYMSNAETAELTRVLRGSSSSMMNLPPPSMHSQMNHYPMGSFTISGLNLNLRGTDTQQQQQQQQQQQDLRSTMQPPPPPPLLAPMNQQDVTSSMFTASHLAADQTVSSYGAADMNNGSGPNNRFMTNMDNCMDLENYWPAY